MINISARLPHSGAQEVGASIRNKAFPVSSQLLARKHAAPFAAAMSNLGSNSEPAKPAVLDARSQANATRQVPAATVTPGWVSRGFAALVPTTPASPAAPATPANSPATPAVSSSKPAQHWYASDPFDDAYWAKQPPAVQQLREIDDMAERTQLAWALTAQGYSIDVPIMVWGWDAGKVTQLRQSYGYTWVPSGGQQPITAAPGLSGPGITPYDPAHPPVGSIKV